MIKILVSIISLSLCSCGYSLQTSKYSSLRERFGIQKIYIKPVTNNTFKSGAETTVYHEILQIFLSGEKVNIVKNEQEADATLNAVVVTAEYKPSAFTSAPNLYPSSVRTIDVPIASEYLATLNCKFELNSIKNSQAKIWEISLGQSKRFAANNQKGVFGRTNALINETEFDRALKENAHAMIQELHENLLSMF